MISAVEMASDGMIHIPSFMTIISGIRVILRALTLPFERLYSVGITDERHLLCRPLKLAQVALYIYIYIYLVP
jgi:hypothetical protein